MLSASPGHTAPNAAPAVSNHRPGLGYGLFPSNADSTFPVGGVRLGLVPTVRGAAFSGAQVGRLAPDEIHFSGRLPQTLNYKYWMAEHQKWFPNQKMRLATALEGFKNRLRTWVAGCMIAMASVIPMPQWLLKPICRAYFYAPRKVLNPLRLKPLPGEGLNGDGEALNKSILSKSFQVAPKTSNLNTIHSFYLKAQEGKPTIVFSHGRDTNIGHLGGLFQGAKNEGYGFFAYDYPGFGRSEGHPDEKNLEEAGIAACHYLAGKNQAGEAIYCGSGYGVPYNQQILMGYSLGGAVAVKVAARLEAEAQAGAENLPRGLILVNTFTDIKSAFQVQFNRFHRKVAQWFVPERTELKFDTVNNIRQVKKTPVMVVHCENDPVVPIEQGKTLYNVLQGQKDFMETQKTGHKFNKPKQLQDILKRAAEKKTFTVKTTGQ